jgi:outer membrane receptor protein involved in Fe transport
MTTQRKNFRLHLFGLLFIGLLLAAATMHAQSGATLAGSVQDPQGRPVPGTEVTLVSRTGAIGDAATTDSSGRYHFNALPQGDYLLRASARGFALFLADDIHIGAPAETRDVHLQIAGVREQVVVTASGTPQVPEQVSKATTVITQADADARDASALSDVVAYAPGVRVQQLGGAGALTSIKIRGMRSEDTALLVDGLRLRDAAATQGDATGMLEDILFTNASQVEVMRGAGSSLYGTNAVTGVVNVITDAGGGRTRGNILLEGGSLGASRDRAQLAGGFLDDRIQYSAGVAETYVANGVGGDNPYRDTSVQGRVTFHLAPTLRLTARLLGADSFAKVMGSPDALGSLTGLGIVNAIALSPSLTKLYETGTPLSQIKTGNATFIPAPDNPDSTRAARFVSAALLLNGQASPSLDYVLSYQLVSNGRRYGDGPAGVDFQPAGSTRSLYDGRIQTADAQIHYRLGPHNLLSIGYEFENENYAFDTTDQSDPTAASGTNVTERSHSFFAQDQARLLGDRLQLSAAFRAQVFDLDTPRFLPLAGAPYQGISFASPTPAYTGDLSGAYFFRKSGTKLRAHAGRGYRAPSLFERFGAGYDSFFGYTVYGDPRLGPEHSTSIDAGIDQAFLSGKLKTSATYFYTWRQNAINFDTSGLISPADPFGRFIGYLNTKGGISRGVEVSAALAPTRSLKVVAAYTYVNAIERAPLVGDILQSFAIPKNQFSLQVTEQPTSRLTLILDTIQSSSYLTPMFGTSGTQTYRFDGLRKINAGVGYRIPLKEYQAVRFFVRANNIFNQTYFENGFLTEGRTALGGLQYEF